MELVNIGFGNLIAAGRLIAVVSPDSAPIKRLIQETRDGGMLIDATYGRKTPVTPVLGRWTVSTTTSSRRRSSTGWWRRTSFWSMPST